MCECVECASIYVCVCVCEYICECVCVSVLSVRVYKCVCHLLCGQSESQHSHRSAVFGVLQSAGDQFELSVQTLCGLERAAGRHQPDHKHTDASRHARTHQ